MAKARHGGRTGSRGDPWSDHYTYEARKSGYPARSVFKLQEIQRKYRLMHRGQRILDLGCAPGSWLLYAAQVTGDRGRVVGMDLTPVSIALSAQVATFVTDVLRPDPDIWEAAGREFDVVLSDMAPGTTGAKAVDAQRSLELCRQAFSVARERLVPGGAFVCKIFFGEDVKAFTDTVRKAFSQTRLFKPASSRKASREIYIIGIDKV